jgi:addiction module RelB/DinJ family antitoxin
VDAIIKSRIDLDLKTDVERVLATLGLTVSDAIRLTFKQISARQGLPFDVKIPNAQTQSAMRDADAWVAAMRAGAQPHEAQTTEQLFESLSKVDSHKAFGKPSKAPSTRAAQ